MTDIVERLRAFEHPILSDAADTIEALTAERDALLAALAEAKAGEEVKPIFGIRFKLSFDSKGRCTTFYKSQAEELQGEWVWLIKATDGMNSPLYASSTPALTYSSTQETECAYCGVRKHTPLRRDEMGGYVCLTCIDKQLDSQRQQLSEAVAALKPFAREADGYDAYSGLDETGAGTDCYTVIKLCDLRRARDTVRKVKGQQTVEKQNSGDNP